VVRRETLERRALQAVTREIVGIHVLLTHSLFACDILRRFFRRGRRYKLSPAQQAEAIKMIRAGEKSQNEIAELFNADRSTISRMMKEVREKELLKAAR
jgi:DNA-binding MarR family transcriptional regulator